MNPMIPLRRALGVAMVAALAWSCGGSGQPTASPAGSTPAGALDPAGRAVTMEPFVEGLDSPLAAVNAGDGSGRLFVVEQGGLIRIVRDGKLLPDAFLDVSAEVKSGGEQGLLGLAFHPDYPKDPRFFVDYTDTNGDTHVASFTVDPSNPDRADPSSEQRLLFVDQPYANHNGGALAFGPDGDLYVALGDGGSGGDPHGNGQKLSTMLGKILRIDVGAAGATAYTVPPDNPFVSTSGAEPAIFALRAPEPVALLVRPRNRRPLDRRRRAGRVGGGRRRPGRHVRRELRLEPDGSDALLPAPGGLRRKRAHDAGRGVLP